MKIDGKIEENKDFGFYLDEKVTMWRRHYFDIEAQSKKSALEKVKTIFSTAMSENNCYPENIDYTEDEDLYDSTEFLHPEDNGGFSTMELYDSETDQELMNNRV